MNPAAFPVTLDSSVQENGVIRVQLSETVHDELIYTEVTLTKTDITGAKPLPGAEIEVKNDQGEVIYRAVTDENGQIPRIPVTPGRYTFHEVLAPDGYALSEAERSFTVDESGDVTGDTVLQDDYTRVTLLKQNENGLPLAGVELALQKEDGSMLMTAVSDELGIVTFEKIPFGSYTIVETAPLSGYLRSGVNVCLTVDGSFVNPIQPLATIVNRPMEILLHEMFLQLIWKMLKAGYMEQWTYETTYSGVPQGSGVSPVLCNIYLNELDRYMEQYAKAFNTQTSRKRLATAYRTCIDRTYRYRCEGNKIWDSLTPEEKKKRAKHLKKLQAAEQAMTPTVPKDTSYKRIQSGAA